MCDEAEIVIPFNPLKDEDPHLFTGQAVHRQPVNQLFFQRGKKALHSGIVDVLDIANGGFA